MSKAETINQQMLTKLNELVGFMHEWNWYKIHSGAIEDYNAVDKAYVDKGIAIAAKLTDLIKKGANVDIVGNNGFTPLHVALLINNHEFIRFLIQYKADIRATTSEGQTPLHSAARSNNAVTISLLMHHLRNGKILLDSSDLEAKDHNGNTPLQDAMISSNKFANVKKSQFLLNVVYVLLTEGADYSTIVETASEYNQKALQDILQDKQKYIKTVFDVISSRIALMNGFKEQWCINPSLSAKSWLDVVDFLRENAAKDIANTVRQIGDETLVRENPNIQWTMRGVMVQICGQYDKISDLKNVQNLDAEAVARLQGFYWNSARNLIEKVAMPMVESGVDCMIQDEKGHTLLHMAAYFKMQHEFDVLLAKGANRDAVNNYGASIMDYGRRQVPLNVADFTAIKLPQERWKICLDDLQKSLNAKSSIKQTTIDVMLMLLAMPEIDPNNLVENLNPLYLIAQSGDKDLLTKAVARNGNFNDNQAALFAVIAHGKTELNNLVFTDLNLGLEAILAAIKYQIENKKFQQVATVLRMSNAAAKVFEENNNGNNNGKKFIADLNEAANKITNKAAQDEVKKVVRQLAEQITKNSANAPAANSMSKTEREKIKKAENKAKREEEARQKTERDKEAADNYLASVQTKELKLKEQLIKQVDIFALTIDKIRESSLKYETLVAEGKIDADSERVYTAEDNQHLEMIKVTTDKVKDLIIQGADVNLKRYNEYTLLHLAIIANNYDLLKFVIEHGGNIRAVNGDGETPLHSAALTSNNLIISFLMHHLRGDKMMLARDDLEAKDNNGYTPLQRAIIVSNEISAKNKIPFLLHTVLVLISEGADFLEKDIVQLSAECNRSEIDEIIEERKNYPSSLDSVVTRMSLMYVEHEQWFLNISQNNLTSEEKIWLEIIDVLEEESVDKITAAVRQIKETADEQAEKNDPDVQRASQSVLNIIQNEITQLNDIKIDTELTKEKSIIAQQFYLKRIRKLITKVAMPLIENGVDVGTKSDKGNTLLHFVAYAKMPQEFDLLLAKGADLGAVNDLDESILSYSTLEILPDLNKIIPPQERWQVCVAEMAKAIKQKAKVSDEVIEKMSHLLDLKAINFSPEQNAGHNILHLMAQADKHDLLKKTLSQKSDSLTLEMVLEVIKYQAEKRGGQAVAMILEMPQVVEKIKEAEKTNDFFEAVNTSANSITKKEIKVAINGAVNELKKLITPKIQQKPRDENQNVSLENLGELSISGDTSSESKPSDASGAASPLSDENDNLESLIADSSATALSPQNNLSVFTLSSQAKEFVPLEIRHRENRLQEETKQMRQFLAGPRKIESIADLPEFLRPKIQNFLANDCLVFLKGSAIYPAQKLSDRLPNDLDLEVLVRGISKLNDAEIQRFVQHNFDVQIDSKNIYRVENFDTVSGQTKQVFTLNFKDEKRALDISIYDRNTRLLPESFLGWNSSRDVKKFFKSDGSVKTVRPLGLEKHISDLHESGVGFDWRKDFFINPNSRGLVLRLCFLQSTQQKITKEELAQSWPQLGNRNPIDLVFEELKLKNHENPPAQEAKIREKIFNFMHVQHNLSPELQHKFLQSLIQAMEVSVVMPPSNPTKNPYYHTLYDTVNKIAQEVQKVPRTEMAPEVTTQALQAHQSLTK